MTHVRHPGLTLAVILSAMLHVAALALPGLHFPGLDEWLSAPEERLEARLAAAPLPPVRAASRPHRQRPAPSLPAPRVPAPLPSPVSSGEDVPSAPGPVESAPAVEAPPVDAVPASAEREAVPPLPPRGRIRFAITRGGGSFVIGRSVHTWQHDGRHYEMSATTETTGIAALFHSAKVVQRSSGRFVAGDLKPEEYRIDRGGEADEARFDWSARRVSLSSGAEASVADGAEDMLSMFYQLIVAAERGEGFQMAVANGRKMERYAFDWLEGESVTTGAGTFSAWHVRIRAVSGGNDVTEVWLGREVAGLPIRIRHVDRKGDRFDQVAEEIDYEGKGSTKGNTSP